MPFSAIRENNVIVKLSSGMKTGNEWASKLKDTCMPFSPGGHWASVTSPPEWLSIILTRIMSPEKHLEEQDPKYKIL